MTPPAVDGPEGPVLARPSPRVSIQRRSLTPQPREWWDHVPQRPVRRHPFESAAAFEFDVPEHLPSSPLCAANRKHASGGTGLCVYHGRARAKSMLRDETLRDQSSDTGDGP